MSTILLEAPEVVEDVGTAPASCSAYDAMIAQMEAPLAPITDAAIKAFKHFENAIWNGCACPICKPQQFARPFIELPEPAVLAACFERAAAFVSDPASSKVRGRMAVYEDDEGHEHDALPASDQATKWCAVGYIGKALGENNVNALCGSIESKYPMIQMSTLWRTFDREQDEQCARRLLRYAGMIASA